MPLDRTQTGSSTEVLADRVPVAQGARARARRHDWIDERSRALAAVVVEHLRRDPCLVELALQTLDRWERLPNREGSVTDPLCQEWRRILTTTPFEDLLGFLVSPSEGATRLRQSSPFVGIISSAERDSIFAAFEAL
ncbi:MAG: hypothetical protein ACR2M1_07615 [Gemmatimonadaceae bacterium]